MKSVEPILRRYVFNDGNPATVGANDDIIYTVNSAELFQHLLICLAASLSLGDASVEEDRAARHTS